MHSLDKHARCQLHISSRATHPGGRSVPRNLPESSKGSITAYGPLSASCSSRNCVSGGRSRAQVPHSGVDLQAAKH